MESRVRPNDHPPSLIGRSEKSGSIQRLLVGVRAGVSGVLVVRGGAGVGKTSLVREAVRGLTDRQVVSIEGVESELELPYAALHRVLGRYLSAVDALPAPQRDALEVVFGLKAGDAPDHFLVGLATLTLLTDAAKTSFVVWLVDDAQWIDQSSLGALAFAARRLLAEKVLMLFCVRDTFDPPALRALPALKLHGLPAEAALELLRSHETVIDAHVARQLLAEADGNPLALIEFSRGLTPSELAGNCQLSNPLPLVGRLEALFWGQIRRLPEAAQMILLIAAAEPSGDADLLWKAAEICGVPDATRRPPDLTAFLTLHPNCGFATR